MNIKSSIATVLLVASLGAVSACDSTGSSAAPPPATPASPASATAPASAPAAPASTGGPSPKGSSAATRTDIPDSVLLSPDVLSLVGSGKWVGDGGRPTTPGAQMLDPDLCDPAGRPQYNDPNYPRNSAWVNLRGAGWKAPGEVQAAEAVVTYSSAAAAAADFAKHRGWVANCAAHFVWTDAPQKFTVTPVSLSGVSGAYAYHVAMDAQDAKTPGAGAQGFDYVAVVLRGNSITFLNVAQSAITGPVVKDPGAGGLQQDVRVLVPQLEAAYGA